MIYSYGMSIVGTSHKIQNKVCQDANKIVTTNNGWVIAAIADGVGSSAHSDIASSIAVDIITKYCVAEIETSTTCNLVEVLTSAFSEAELEIEKKSVADSSPITDYDTTLSVVIYDGKNVTFGHCGDGGIIGLSRKGDYLKITTPQKLEGMYVVPLRNGKDTRQFGVCEEEIASVLLATDGVYDVFFPYLLKGQLVEVYMPLIRYFMDNNLLQTSDANIKKIQAERESFLGGEESSSITDDKTIVVLINGAVTPDLKDEQYYTEPDWDSLQLEWNKKAYPHMFKEEEKTP